MCCVTSSISLVGVQHVMSLVRDYCFAVMISGRKEMYVLIVVLTTIAPNGDTSSGK
jgi:hypothetical protein